ncbi:MAG TPA: tRNA (adenosine(37)-N6)-threonylcarbamoyltransferase complex dimerization subunit type 1 TsaB [Flavitalea sp.]|nr:tRNA (adenosine(37)-N6)-threonylcarbamoyltransferase complex dimerization subunit type 1 TsaB [Flavitalea sp.]
MSALILNIDTALPEASICIARGGRSIGMAENNEQQDHAAWIHLAIASLLQETGCALQELDAIAVTGGPGSYTGLRVGLSTAKGFCFTLQKPLIVENTLKVMAVAAANIHPREDEVLFCPMVDARRMEVFTAIYSPQLEALLSPRAIVLDDTWLDHFPLEKEVLFFGNGSSKFRLMNIAGTRHRFSNIQSHAGHLAILADELFRDKKFEDLATAVPFYGKEFYTPAQK